MQSNTQTQALKKTSTQDQTSLRKDRATKKHTSHVVLTDDVKEKLVATLNLALATSIDLELQIKQAHWNVKGPEFIAVHELFDTIAEHVREHADEIAERASTLGGYAEGTIRLSAQSSKLPEYDLEAVDARAHLRALVERFEAYGKLLRSAIDQTEELNDPITEDLYVEVLRGAEKDLWMLESHLNVDSRAT